MEITLPIKIFLILWQNQLLEKTMTLILKECIHQKIYMINLQKFYLNKLTNQFNYQQLK
jgi:hypothetical protein